MAEQLCRVSPEIELCYETFGDPTDPPMLMVMGLAAQMIAWPDELCQELAGNGFHVIRFDNRDSGHSTHVRGGAPSIVQLAVRSRRAAHYTLADMAADAAGLLRQLEVGPAHVVGASMGGMIAQTIASRHPESVLSLTSIMSTTGSRLVGQPAIRLYPMLARRPAGDREATIERTVKLFGIIGSRGLPQDPDHIRELAGRSWDRDHDPRGPARQLAAIGASGNRTAELHRIAVPTLVIHGSDDPLVRPSGGRATARAIPGARLEMIEGMAHDLPRAAWPRIVEAIVANARSAQPAPQPA